MDSPSNLSCDASDLDGLAVDFFGLNLTRKGEVDVGKQRSAHIGQLTDGTHIGSDDRTHISRSI